MQKADPATANVAGPTAPKAATPIDDKTKTNLSKYRPVQCLSDRANQ